MAEDVKTKDLVENLLQSQGMFNGATICLQGATCGTDLFMSGAVWATKCLTKTRTHEERLKFLQDLSAELEALDTLLEKKKRGK